MIQTIEGRIGGGKTYTAMGWICNHLSKGGVVATNINVQLGAFEDQYGKKRGLRWVLKQHYGYDLQDSQIIYLSDTQTVDYKTKRGIFQLNEIVMFYKLVPRGTPDQPVLVVVDEAHIHFPQDGYKSLPREVLHFLTLSRHASVDVVFISQHIKNMWCQMLRLSQFRWSVRDMKQYGIPLGSFNLWWPFPHFLQCKNDYDGITLMSRKFEWARKELYEAYRSPELASSFESMEVAASVKVGKRELTMKDKAALVFVGLAAGVAIMIVPACKSRGEAVDSSVGTVPVSEPVAVNREAVAAPSVPPVPVEEIEPEYYTGFISSGFDSKFFTTARIYHLGDLVDGLPLVLVRDREMVLLDESTGAYVVKRFKRKPRAEL